MALVSIKRHGMTEPRMRRLTAVVGVDRRTVARWRRPVNRKLLALYGLKWNPFAPDVPVEALQVSRRIEAFCWRVQQLVGEGGFALVIGAPGTGKSVTLRILAERLAAQRDVEVGIISRPKAGLADFYHEMGDLFGVELAPHDRWAGAKVLRNILLTVVLAGQEAAACAYPPASHRRGRQ